MKGHDPLCPEVGPMPCKTCHWIEQAELRGYRSGYRHGRIDQEMETGLRESERETMFPVHEVQAIAIDSFAKGAQSRGRGLKE